MWEFEVLDNCYTHTKQIAPSNLVVHNNAVYEKGKKTWKTWLMVSFSEITQELNNAAKSTQHKLTIGERLIPRLLAYY